MAQHAATPEPGYQRGQMAARIAVRDARDPEHLALLRRHAQSALELAEQGMADAAHRLAYAHGFQAHLTDLKEKSA